MIPDYPHFTLFGWSVSCPRKHFTVEDAINALLIFLWQWLFSCTLTQWLPKESNCDLLWAFLPLPTTSQAWVNNNPLPLHCPSAAFNQWLRRMDKWFSFLHFGKTLRHILLCSPEFLSGFEPHLLAAVPCSVILPPVASFPSLAYFAFLVQMLAYKKTHKSCLKVFFWGKPNLRYLLSKSG